jgi:hypothetical protein
VAGSSSVGRRHHESVYANTPGAVSCRSLGRTRGPFLSTRGQEIPPDVGPGWVALHGNIMAARSEDINVVDWSDLAAPGMVLRAP